MYKFLKHAKLKIRSVISHLITSKQVSFFFCRFALRVLGYVEAHRFGVKIGWILIADPKIWHLASKIKFLSRNPSNPTVISDIIARYNDPLFCNSRAPISNLWAYNLEDRWGELRFALQSKDNKRVEYLLSHMFRQPFTHGVTYGGNIDLFPHFKTVVGMSIFTHLVEIAEFLGIARAETQEQGMSAYELRSGFIPLLEKISDCIGVSLDFPSVGSPWGIPTKSGTVLHGQIPHIYNALRIKQIVGNRKVDLVEVGGGYGGLCYWTTKLLGDQLNSYTIVDLVDMQMLQYYFLSHSIGNVGFEANAGRIKLVPHFDLEKVGKCDLLINQDSFPEIGEDGVQIYLDWALKNSNYLWSMNQEAYSPFRSEQQLWVSQMAASQKGFKLIFRNRTWVREGYTEELYEISKAISSEP